MMGFVMVGGGLIIGLFVGLVVFMIGIGLVVGFLVIGVSGIIVFFSGVGGVVIIMLIVVVLGSIVGVRVVNWRIGVVKIFEYRLLNNNKRVNFIVIVFGWMMGKVDDVWLLFSIVDLVMGDIYLVLWELEMLISMGDIINILVIEVCLIKVGEGGKFLLI